MPLSKEFKFGDARLAIWSIEEEQDELEELLSSKRQQESMPELNSKRSKEWLSVRCLLSELLGGADYRGLYKDKHGKPHLEESELEISISHSHGQAAAIISPKLVGIDIQKRVPKIKSIAHKFVSDLEQGFTSMDNINQLHVTWGAKESLYKAYGRKELDFKTHIIIEPYQYAEPFGAYLARVEKDDSRIKFAVEYRILSDFILVYAEETT